MAKAKRSQKKRGPGRGPRLENLPVAERLGHFWESGLWELFLAEWAERSQSPKAASWAPFVAAARYNHLTKTLFEDRNLKSALSIASSLLSFKEGLPPLLEACASIALRLGDLDKGALAEGGPGREPALIEPGLLPAPWLRLKKAIDERLKPGQASADPLFKTREKIIRKMERRLLKIAPGASAYSFAAFQKSCEELSETAASARQKEIFGALRELGALIKIVSSKRDPDSRKAEDLGGLLSKGRYAPLRRHLDHRAVLAVWRRLAAVGEARFGRRWSEAAKSLVFKHEPGLDPMARKALAASASSEDNLADWLDSIKKTFNFSPTEKLLLEIAAIHRALDPSLLAFRPERFSKFSTGGEYAARQYYGADKGRMEDLRRRFVALDKSFKECELPTSWNWGVGDCFLNILKMVPEALADLSRWAFPFDTASDQLLSRVIGISRDLPLLAESMRKAERVLRLDDPKDLLHMAGGLIWRLCELAQGPSDLDEAMRGLETVMTPEAFEKTVRALVAVALLCNADFGLPFRDPLGADGDYKPERLDKVFARMPKTLARIKGSVQYRLLALSTSLGSPLDKAPADDVGSLIMDITGGDETDAMVGLGLVTLNMLKHEPDMAIIKDLVAISHYNLVRLDIVEYFDDFINEKVLEDRVDLMKMVVRGGIATEQRRVRMAKRIESWSLEEEEGEEERERERERKKAGRGGGFSSKYAEMRREWAPQDEGEWSFDPSALSDPDSFHYMAARIVDMVLNLTLED
jgi:hypothetical protein